MNIGTYVSTPRVKRSALVAVVGLCGLAGALVPGSAGVSEARSQGPRSLHMISPTDWRRAAGPAHPPAQTHPMARSRLASSGAIKSNEQLTLPASAFPPTFRERESYSLTAARADNMELADLHARSYAAAGMLGGWWQYYVDLVPGGYFDIVYLGSYYPDSDAAARAFNDVASNLSQYGQVTTCRYGDQCVQATVSMTWPDGEYQGIYRIVQMSNAVGELQAIVPADSWSNFEPQVRTDLDRAAASFEQVVTQPPTSTPVPPTATPSATVAPTATSAPVPTATSIPVPTATRTPVPVNFTVLAARVERAGSKPDLTLARSPIHQVRTRSTVYLSLYATVRSAPADAPVQYELTLSRPGNVLLRRTASSTAASIPSGTFRTFAKARLTRTGTLTFTARMTVGGQSQERATTIRVVK